MIKEFVDTYAEAISQHLKGTSEAELLRTLTAMRIARRNGHRIFVAGNGGSAAISEHLTCDFMKGCYHGKETLITHSLSSNFPLISALANDISYDEVFSKQLEYMDLKRNDLVFLISSSGNSPNIVKAAEFVSRVGSGLVGMTGFTGGRLKELSSISLHIPIHNYGIVEDCHQALMHILSQIHKKEQDKWL